jgi:hypothetical protein
MADVAQWRHDVDRGHIALAHVQDVGRADERQQAEAADARVADRDTDEWQLARPPRDRERQLQRDAEEVDLLGSCGALRRTYANELGPCKQRRKAKTGHAPAR